MIVSLVFCFLFFCFLQFFRFLLSCDFKQLYRPYDSYSINQRNQTSVTIATGLAISIFVSRDGVDVSESLEQQALLRLIETLFETSCHLPSIISSILYLHNVYTHPHTPHSTHFHLPPPPLVCIRMWVMVQVQSGWTLNGRPPILHLPPSRLKKLTGIRCHLERI